MAVSHVELYEALKGPVGEKAAQMIAEIVPPAADVARRQDVGDAVSTLRLEIADVRNEVTELRGEMRAGFGAIRSEMHVSDSRTIKWMLAFFVPMWAGTWGTMIAVLIRGA